MAQLNGYVMGIVYASVITAIVMAAAPKGVYRTLLGVASGFLLVLVILKPLTGIRAEDAGELFRTETRETGNFEDEQDKLLKELIEEKTSAYILSKAQAMGIDCRVTVELSGGDPPVPAKVSVSGRDRPPPDAEAALAAMITADCGIPPEGQYYNWES